MRAAVVLGALTAVGAGAACFVGIDESLIGRDAGSDGAVDAAARDASADAGGSDAAAPAEGAVESGSDRGCPAAMIAVLPAGDASARPYCVDSTEVTNATYAAFLAAAEPPAPGSQPGECAWNTTFVPMGWTGSNAPQHPVVGLNWCDAWAVCAWQGKHLCGAIDGGSVDPSGAVTNAPESQWFNACSGGGTRTYPYGDTFDAQACVGSAYMPTPSGPLPVGQATGCAGGFAGLWDMSGNVEEFVDSCSSMKLCDGGPECELCVLLGGGFHDPGSRLACAYVNLVLRSGQYDDNGARCCAEVP
jgi:sulfatase modifying factor 1